MSKRPAVYRGMLITPKVLLDLGAREDCQDWKRYHKHWFDQHYDGYHRGQNQEYLTLDFLQWAQAEGYDLYAFATLLFPKLLLPPRTPQAIWNALPDNPEKAEVEIPILPILPYPTDETDCKICEHFTARCDAIERAMGNHVVALRFDDNHIRKRIENLEKDNAVESAELKQAKMITDSVNKAFTPDDPYAVGKWVIRKSDGLVRRIAKVDDPLLWLEGETGGEHKDYFTPLDGTPETCKLEIGDEVKLIRDKNSPGRRIIVDIVNDFVVYRIEYGGGSWGGAGHGRNALCVIRRPPKEPK